MKVVMGLKLSSEGECVVCSVHSPVYFSEHLPVMGEGVEVSAALARALRGPFTELGRVRVLCSSLRNWIGFRSRPEMLCLDW